MTSLSESLADFALNLHRGIGQPDKNVFLSPMSISMVMAMTYTGTAGETAAQIKKVMFSGVKEDEIDCGMTKILSIFAAAKEKRDGFQLNLANGIYCRQGVSIKSQFERILKETYKSPIKQVNFVKNRAKITVEINKWVSEQTKGIITNIVQESTFTPDTHMVLVNAIYFKGDWVSKFQKHRTIEKVFYSSPKLNAKVNMMQKDRVRFPYFETDDLQILGMYYNAPKLAMFAFLPKDRYGLEKIENKLTGKMLIELITKTCKNKALLDVEFPKFKMRESLRLPEILKKLGICHLFANSANFSNMYTGAVGDIWVSDIIHEAYVHVNEKGTEAAASTVLSQTRGIGNKPPPLPKFIADHSFFFVICDLSTMSLLFAGRFTNPNDCFK